MKFVFDFMGVLFEPGHIIRNGFYPLLRDRFTYEELKSAYKKAVLGDSHLLNSMVPVEEQRKILLSVVKPKFDFSMLKGIRAYGLTNLPAFWGFSLYETYLGNYFSGVFVSGAMGIKKPDEEVYRRITGVLGKDIIFFDDKVENVNNAKKAGWNAVLVKDDVVELIKKFL